MKPTTCRPVTLCTMVLLTSCSLSAQDSLRTTSSTQGFKRHEVGVSVLTPLIILAGATDYNERFTNITYRFRKNKNHAFKTFAGLSRNETPLYYHDQPAGMLGASGNTVYPEVITHIPSNFQLGAGYEFIIGRRVQQAFGLDFVYNNKFEKQEHFYREAYTVAEPNGMKRTEERRLDTGSFVTSRNYDKIGFDLSYSLRFPLAKRWLVTASVIGSYRYFKGYDNGRTYSIHDWNINGLLSDVSIFYRFGRSAN
jgi:hypothetical protein